MEKIEWQSSACTFGFGALTGFARLVGLAGLATFRLAAGGADFFGAAGFFGVVELTAAAAALVGADVAATVTGVVAMAELVTTAGEVTTSVGAGMVDGAADWLRRA